MKKTLIIALVLIVGFSCCTILVPPLISAEPSGYWADYAAEAFSAGDGTELDPYQISTPEELAYLATSASSSGFTSGVYFELTADLDMSAHYWSGLNSVFNGYFDGGNHMITNLTGDTLFSQAGNMQNLRLVNVNMSNSALTLSGGNLNNIRVSGQIVFDGGDYAQFGGIIGQGTGTIEKCVNFADITVAQNDYASCRVGGVVGDLDIGGAITNCANYGNIVTTADSKANYVGGIVGAITRNCSVTYCLNLGDVSATLASPLYVAGISGRSNYSSDVTFSYCLNMGSVTAVAGGQSNRVYSGSIVGQVGGGSLYLNHCVHYAPSSDKGTITPLGQYIYWGNGGANVTTCLTASSASEAVTHLNSGSSSSSPAWATSASITNGLPHLTALYWEDV